MGMFSLFLGVVDLVELGGLIQNKIIMHLILLIFWGISPPSCALILYLCDAPQH